MSATWKPGAGGPSGPSGALGRRGTSRPSPPTLAVPDRKPGRSYGETFGSSGFTGDVTLTLPLPQNVSRLSPDLALAYSHGGANGPFGLGVSLSLGTIARRTDTGIPSYTDQDVFLGPDGAELTPGFSPDGRGGWAPEQRSVSEDGVSWSVRRYRTRVDGAAAKIERWTGPEGAMFWRVRDGANTLTTFGKTALARIADPAAPWRIASWLPEETIDANGNRVVYRYKPEDNDGWRGVAFLSPAQRYLAEIRYGNYLATGATEETFAFSLVFDYGEYDPLSGGAAPIQAWPARSDPQTSFRTGFPVQTLRLCRSVFSVNHLPEAAHDAQPLVDEVLSLSYADRANQKLVGAQLTGQRRARDGALEAAALPPLTLAYAPFRPDAGAWRRLIVAGADTLPAAPGGATLAFADIRGEGLPGLVFTADATLSYAPPLGGGRYGALEPLPRLPAAVDQPGYALRDLEGSGHLSLVATTPEYGGFFFNRNDGDWDGFRVFPSYAAEAASSDSQWVDLNGDGLADVLVAAGDQTRAYLSRGAEGFAPALTLVPTPATQDPGLGGEARLSGFFDMFGDGLQHRVQVRSGRVDVWPNLGYGHFGARISWPGAPSFGEAISAERILLGPIVAGAADLLLVYPDHGLLYPNGGVAGFGEPVRLAWPCLVGPTTRVSIVDLLGDGHGCLVVSQQAIVAAAWYLDLCDGAFPGLLAHVDNGLGGGVDIAYRSSTDFYLADLAHGEPWLTKLASPVVVVDRLDHRDAVSGLVTTERRQYRDGYFDPVDCRFRGFGYVQSINTRAIGQALWRFPDLAESADPDQGAAQLTRQWSYVGAFVSPGAEVAGYAPSFFDGGGDVLSIGASVLAPPIRAGDAETVREATAALAGSPIRTETWSVAADGALGAAPLQVEEHSQTVTQLQPHLGDDWSSVLIMPRESATLHYEGVPADPRIAQDATLAWDAFGAPTRSVTVYYPRAAPLTPAQGALRIVAAEDGWINQDADDLYLIGTPYETADHELAGLAPDQGRWFSWDGLATGAAAALAHPIDYGQPFASGPQARPFLWSRSYYWDAGLTRTMPLGRCGPRPLLHHAADAVFPPSFVASAYRGAVTDAMLVDAALGLDAGLWWAPGDTCFYAADGYYQPIGFQTVFQTVAAHTVLGYDAYWLFVTRSTDALGFSLTARPDYQALEPWEVTDANAMTTQGLYTPLKQLAVISQHATIEGRWQGGMDLAEYQPQPTPDLAALVADPAKYLQGAFGFFLAGYPAGGQPAYLASVQAMAACDAAGGGAAAEPGLNLAWLDGFGRSLEALQRVEIVATPGGPAEGWRWRSGSRIDYDQQDRVLRSYVPIYQDGFGFAPAGARPFTAYHYDALDRQIRVDTAKGFILLNDFPDGWTTRQWDADDTVLQSPYYRDHIDDPDLPPAEKRALEQAARFADTPTSELLDPQGAAVRIDEINVDADGVTSTLSTTLAVDVRGLVTAAVDPRLSEIAGLHNLDVLYDMLERPVRVTRVDSGDELLLRDALGETVRHWNAQGDAIETVFERPIRRPQRRMVTPVGSGEAIEVATFAYGDDPTAQTVNRLVRQRDQAGVETSDAYDIGGRVTRASRQFAQSPATPIDWSGPVPLESKLWPMGWRYDPSGRPLEQDCADGSRIAVGYFANGWMRQVAVTPAGAAAATLVEDAIRYEPGGMPVAARYGDGVGLEWTYDALTGDLIASVATRASDQARVQDLAYVYDPHGNVSTAIDHAAAALMGGGAEPLAKQYAFDGVYQLTGATGWEQARDGWRAYSQTLRYDRGGNLTAIVGSNGAVALTVAAESNHAVATAMVAPGEGVDSFFDAAGNLRRLADGAALAYDFADRLVSVTPSGSPSPTARYSYGEDGLRLRKTFAGSDVYTLGAAYIEARGEAYRTSLLVPGANGDLVFVSIDGGRLAPSYLINDRLGSVTLELGDDGAVQRYQDFYPYGGLSVTRDVAPPPLPAQLGFSGKQRDPETGLSYFGGRYYLSAWGRWLTPDPMGEIDGLNLYEYVGGNPVTATDPSGFGATYITKRRRRTRPLSSRRRSPILTQPGDVLTIKTTVHYGSSKIFGSKGYGGTLLTVLNSAGGSGAFSFYLPRSGNTGKGISRQYPITSVGYRQSKSLARLRTRQQRSMFRFKDKSQIGYVRGHQIPHADTLTNSPLSGGLISTRDKLNYYPEPEGWGEQQRKHREAKARGRETPILQYNEYSATPTTTNDGTRVPDRIYFIELTGWSTNKTYSGSKSYNIKAYKVEYSTFNYDALPRKNTSDRRQTKPLRVTALPSGSEPIVRQITGYTATFKF